MEYIRVGGLKLRVRERLIGFDQGLGSNDDILKSKDLPSQSNTVLSRRQKVSVNRVRGGED